MYITYKVLIINFNDIRENNKELITIQTEQCLNLNIFCWFYVI